MSPYLHQPTHSLSYTVLSTRTKLRERVFSVTGLTAWKSLPIGGGGVSGWGGHHDECGARAYNGGAESILVIGCPTEPANLAPVRENSMLCYGPLVSELGGPECMVPQPHHWEAVPPPAPPPMAVASSCLNAATALVTDSRSTSTARWTM